MHQMDRELKRNRQQNFSVTFDLIPAYEKWKSNKKI
jgi:hypothetical protein